MLFFRRPNRPHRDRILVRLRRRTCLYWLFWHRVDLVKTAMLSAGFVASYSFSRDPKILRALARISQRQPSDVARKTLLQSHSERCCILSNFQMFPTVQFAVRNGPGPHLCVNQFASEPFHGPRLGLDTAMFHSRARSKMGQRRMGLPQLRQA